MPVEMFDKLHLIVFVRILSNTGHSDLMTYKNKLLDFISKSLPSNYKPTDIVFFDHSLPITKHGIFIE
jgi:hypothetical protein